ncbi:DNA damage-induced apoptosis suppressor protein [Hoplias malabaricus]|uniref:DNA damage-induced apoptosis suppressor protein n=1 Tax=Hoplias malabaricus TaxID=27720 RepID=UPI0034627F38
MNTKKVLVSCTVISLQDTRFVYPCCKFCLSRSTLESDLRYRCIKCGFTCDIQNVDYRYRLSFKVSRGRNIFGVTVFGGCLNSFFGIPAGGLQRFVDSGKQEGPLSIQHLLIKAVEDCFIGKKFIFGFKLNGLSDCTLFDEHISSDAGSAQIVACQIIPSNGTSLGMTVLAYLQSLFRAISHPSCFPSCKTICQSQQKESLLSSFDYTLPLCVESDSEDIGLTQLWQPASDIVLSFSPEETSGHSLRQTMVDDIKCVLSQNENAHWTKPEPEWPTKSYVGQEKSTGDVQHAGEALYTTSASENVELIGGTYYRECSSKDISSTLSKVPDKLDASAVLTGLFVNQPLPSLNTLSCAHMLARTECSPSFFEKTLSRSGQHSRISLADAPLSESLGSFVSIETNVSKAVNKKEPNPVERNQATTRKSNCVLTPLHNITNMISSTNRKSLKRLLQKGKVLSLSKPCLPGTPKVSQVPNDSSLGFCDIKHMVSKSLTKNPVHTDFQLHCVDRDNNVIEVSFDMQSQGLNEQEVSPDSHQDEYNCSADLFYQTSADITLPKETKKFGLLDSNTSEHKVCRSFSFAPSMQSTPIAHPCCCHSYRQRHRFSRKCSDSPCFKNRTVLTSRFSALGTESTTIQQPRVVKQESSDFAHGISVAASELSVGVSEKEADEELYSKDSFLPTNFNEWSRDLFAD